MNSGRPIRLAPGEVQLWLIPLDVGSSYVERLLPSLSGDEIERASRMRIQRPRDHFIVARGAIRTILGQILSIPPHELAFNYGPHGKPDLANPGLHGIQFNLSHSSDLAVLAINLEFQIGVDIETSRPGRPFMKLAERFFSAREVADLHALPDESVMDGFYSCWTRKEAYLKAIGTGLTTPLNAFDVTLKPGERPALVGQRLEPADTERWIIREIAVPEGYRAAVATQWKSPRIITHQWHGFA